MTQSATPLRDRGSVLAATVSLVVGLACPLGGAAVVWSQRHRLPERVVTHWGADGRADGFASVPMAVGMSTLMPLAWPNWPTPPAPWPEPMAAIGSLIWPWR